MDTLSILYKIYSKEHTTVEKGNGAIWDYIVRAKKNDASYCVLFLTSKVIPKDRLDACFVAQRMNPTMSIDPFFIDPCGCIYTPFVRRLEALEVRSADGKQWYVLKNWRRMVSCGTRHHETKKVFGDKLELQYRIGTW